MKNFKINLEGTNPVETFDISKERLPVLQTATAEATIFYKNEEDANKAYGLAFDHLGKACETPNEIAFCFFVFPEILSFANDPMAILTEILKLKEDE